MQPSVGHSAGFWVVAAVFLTTMAYCTVPTPLYPLYQQRVQDVQAMVLSQLSEAGRATLAARVLAMFAKSKYKIDLGKIEDYITPKEPKLPGSR